MSDRLCTVDGVKLQTTLTDEQTEALCSFLQVQGSKYNETWDRNSEGLKTKTFAEYKGLGVSVKHKPDCTSTVIISGSLHKYSNKGEHNSNDFTINGLVEVISDLERTLLFNPLNTYIQNLEAGINITPPIDTHGILDALLVHAPGGPLAEFIKIKMPGLSNYREAEHSNYYIKAYDKALQYRLPESIFRFEVKYMKAECFHNTGIKTLHDLTDIDKLNKLNNHLTKRWQEVIFFDPTLREHELTRDQQDLLPHWNNKSFWTKLSERNTPTNKNHIYNERKKFDRVFYEHSEHLKKQIADLITEKIRNFDRPITRAQNRNFDTLCIGSMLHSEPEPLAVCMVTGLDISDQRSGSRFISEARVNGLYYQDKQKFYDLAFEYGPTDRANTIEKLAYYIAHNVRNRESNQRQRLMTSNKRYKNALFDIDPYTVLPSLSLTAIR